MLCRNENFKSNRTRNENNFHSADHIIAKRLLSQGIDPYISDCNTYYADLYSSDFIEDHGRELRHWSSMFHRYEMLETKALISNLTDYLESHPANHGYHLSGRLIALNECHVSNIRRSHNKIKKTIVDNFRYKGIQCLMLSMHHKPIDADGEHIDIHFHAMLADKPDAEQMRYLNARYTDLYCKKHFNPDRLISYMHKGMAHHVGSFTDENLAEYCKQTIGLRRFCRLGEFGRFCAELEKQKRFERELSRSPVHLSHTRIPSGEPIICKVKLIERNGELIPMMVIKAKHFDANDYKALEQKYNLDSIRESYLVNNTAHTKYQQSSSESAIHFNTLCKYLNTSERQLE